MSGFIKNPDKEKIKVEVRPEVEKKEVKKDYLFKLQHYSISELASLYGITDKTLVRKMKPFGDRVGNKFGRRYSPKQVAVIFDNIKGPFFTLKQLAGLYDGITPRCLSNWLRPIADKLDELGDGGSLNIDQIRVIVDFLGEPSHFFDDPEMNEKFLKLLRNTEGK